jgi:hypothetical protein
MNDYNNDNMNDIYDNTNDLNDISFSVGDEDIDNSRLLKVQLYDTKGSYTILEAYPGIIIIIIIMVINNFNNIYYNN